MQKSECEWNLNANQSKFKRIEEREEIFMIIKLIPLFCYALQSNDYIYSS